MKLPRGEEIKIFYKPETDNAGENFYTAIVSNIGDERRIAYMSVFLPKEAKNELRAGPNRAKVFKIKSAWLTVDKFNRPAVFIKEIITDRESDEEREFIEDSYELLRD